jgi:hypothetical protein
MEPEGSLQFSNKYSTAHIHSKVNAVHIVPFRLFKINCNIIPSQCLNLLHGMFRSSLPINISYSFFICPTVIDALLTMSMNKAAYLAYSSVLKSEATCCSWTMAGFY